MSLGARFFGDREGGWVHPKGTCKQHGGFLTLAVESHWSALGGPFLILCTNGLRKQSSGHVGPPFL